MAGLGLIVPVLNGLIDEKHFEGIKHAWIIGDLLASIPFEKTNKNIFVFMMILIVASVYLENILVYFGKTAAARVSTDMIHGVRTKMFERCLQFSKAFYDKQHTGELNTLLTKLVTDAGNLINQLSQIVILASFSSVFFAMMIAISWKLTLFSFVLLPVTHYIAKSITKRIHESAKKEVDHLISLSDHSLDTLRVIPLAQITGSEERELKRFEDASDQVREAGFNVKKKRHSIPSIIDIVNSTGVVLLVCVGVFMFVSTSSYSLGRLLVYLVCLRRLASHLQQLASTWSQCVAIFPSLDKVLWIFDDQDKSFIQSGTLLFHGLAESIEFKNVSFGYDQDAVVLKDINLEIRSGEILAVVGSTGSGKTTLINLLPAYYQLEQGQILFDGTDIREFELKGLRNHMSVVSQDTMILSDTIYNNIVYGLDPSEYDEQTVANAVEAAQLSEFIADLPDGLHTSVGPRGMRLSGGERQRISIARALLKDPEILILDEATSALDAETEQKVQKAIDDLVVQRTVFVVAHRLSTVRKADKVVVLDSGQIVECGSPAQLLEDQGTFYEYCKIQNLFQ